MIRAGWPRCLLLLVPGAAACSLARPLDGFDDPRPASMDDAAAVTDAPSAQTDAEPWEASPIDATPSDAELDAVAPNAAAIPDDGAITRPVAGRTSQLVFPNGCSLAEVVMWGAGGASTASALGGGGGAAMGELTLAPGEVFRVQPGTAGTRDGGGYPNGGAPGNGAGGGGGLSMITSLSLARWLVAGGGGGACGQDPATSTCGAGGGDAGQSSNTAGFGGGFGGGVPDASGQGGVYASTPAPGGDGASSRGGSGASFDGGLGGGGGGSGFVGGGGGGGGVANCGAGGGGSGFVDRTRVDGGTFAGAFNTPALTTHALYMDAGMPGRPDVDGRVLIWCKKR